MSVLQLYTAVSRRSASSSDKSGHTQRDMKAETKSADGWAERKKEAPSRISVGRRMSDVNVRGATETSPMETAFGPQVAWIQIRALLKPRRVRKLTVSRASAARPPGRSYLYETSKQTLSVIDMDSAHSLPSSPQAF